MQVSETKITNPYEFTCIKFNNHKAPEFKEVKGTDWIIFGTESPYYNRYPDYLLNLYNRSAYHSAIINAKTNFIAGNGIQIESRDLDITEKSELMNDAFQANKYGEDITDVLLKCSLDKCLFNSCHLEIIWDKAGKNFEYYHLPLQKLRRDKKDNGYWYSDNWAMVKKSEADEFTKTGKIKTKDEGGTNLQFIPDFDPKNTKGKQVYSLIGYTPDTEAYSRPSYRGCIPYIEVDSEISNFDLNRIKSGFFVGTILSFVGDPTNEQKDELKRNLEQAYTGTDKANSIMLTFRKDKDNKIELTRIPPDELDKQFEQLSKARETSIFVGHGVTNPALFGIKTENVMFERNSILESFELFKTGFIKPEQNQMNKWINNLMFYKGFGKRIKLKDPNIISLIDTATINSVMTVDEKRKAAGLPQLEPNKTAIQEAKNKFSKDLSDEDRLELEMKAFSEFGVSEDELDSFGGEAIESEQLLEKFSILEGDVKTIYKDILTLLDKDPLMSNKDIAGILKMKVERVNRAINALIDAGAIAVDETKSGDDTVRQIVILDEGKSVLDETKSKIENMIIRYKYSLKDGLSNSASVQSRPFCVRLMGLNKFYTREEIEEISRRVDRDVFNTRGGWWTRKGGDITTPTCRHVWKQYITRKKKKQ